MLIGIITHLMYTSTILLTWWHHTIWFEGHLPHSWCWVIF